MLFDPLINQTLCLLLLELLVIASYIRLMLVPRIMLLSDRGRIVGEISVAVVAVIPRHGDGGRQ